ncbi:WUSCHEL-related homeobox 11-like, partial [Raphanus sativus]|uniref:WUSCHEL-related homeobox 11-like n=1 Tax=Raphanus sativus TaxID=3726 RepID=A0A9W3D3V5_RAPSA
MDKEQKPHSTTGHSHSPSSSASGSTSNETVRSRWSPKPEQILILESIFNSGMVNPPKEETVRIRKMLEKFGKVGDANVFYWFQNRRSRSRRRQRQLQAAAAEAATVTNTCDQTMMVSNNLPEHSGSDLGFGGCSTSNYLFASSSYGAGCDDHSNNGMENLLTMSGQMGYHEANQHHYNYHSSNVESILCPSDQSSNYHYQQGSIMVFINGVPTEVTSGGIDMKATFGEDLVLVNSSGVSLPTDQFGFLMHSLQHGEAYFLVMVQISYIFSLSLS